VQTALLKMENNMRFGGHNMGKAPVLLDEYMKEVKAAIVDYATTSAMKHVWWTEEGGGGSHQAQRRHLRRT
jgi:hypothetical protein